MNHSESLTKLAPAFVAAQAQIENAHKNAKNPHFKSNYADLAEIINTIRPTLAAHGLAVVQIPGFADGVLTMETMLMHSSGEWVAGTSGSPIAKQDPQGVGSAITYLRRYSLAALCGIAQEDDDGNAASPRQQVERAFGPMEPAPERTNGETGESATEKQVKFIKSLAASHHIGFDERVKIETQLAGLTKAKAKNLIDRLQKHIAEKDELEKTGAPA